MKRMKRILTLILAAAILSTAMVIGSITASASGSGAGLTEWAYRAYNEGWSYVWGGSSVGAVDCSGLIYSYAGGARITEDMIAASPESGSMDSLPRIHGLGLYQYGHVGVYVGGGKAIDARDEISNVCFDSVYNKSWTQWFKVSGVSYPTNGWEKVNGSYYYYENGQYIVDTTRTINGVTYTFGSDGSSDKTPDDTNATAEKSTTSKKNSGSSKNNSSSQTKVKKTWYALGDSGNAVTKIQNRLVELGFYTGEVTGYFGEDTQKAYKAFQKAAGVTVDGICGKSDRDILYSDEAPKYEAPVEEKPAEEKKQEESKPKDTFEVISLDDEGEKVTEVQERLNELKYLDAEPSGYFDTDTQYAVMDFQDYNSLERTGEVNKKTYKTLFSEDAIVNPDAVDEAEPEEEEEEAKEEEPKEQEELVSFTFRDPVPSDYADYNEVEETAPATSTELVLESHQMASEALAGVATETGLQPTVTEQAKDGLDIIKWLIVVIAVMGCVFVVALVNERKRARRRRKHAVRQSRRYW